MKIELPDICRGLSYQTIRVLKNRQTAIHLIGQLNPGRSLNVITSALLMQDILLYQKISQKVSGLCLQRYFESNKIFYAVND
ncbi:MAG: hypothetical protein COT00_02885 [Candidatus Omnitrophica bacterium CG07_land_8_20_14_0_80_50_8]|nr:MAG: hypothetical protein COT00_02885 [Candidatus Omnitrophica bacterium CG07_land_8_20_14_0_80_50_8]